MKKLALGLFILLQIGITFADSGSSLPPLIGNKDPNKNTLLPGPASGDPEAALKYANDNLLTGLTNNFFIFILAISVGSLIIAGIFYVYSMGDSEQTKRAKDTILWTIVGVFLSAISYTIVSILINTKFF